MTKLSTKYGVAITVGLIVYFLILKVIGLHIYTVLSAFNGVIIGLGIFLAIKEYKRTHKKFKYHKGFRTGIFTGFFATILFAIFMAIFITHIDTEFATTILDRWDANFDFGPFMIVLTVALMGFSTSFVLTLAFMQLLKESWNTTPSENQ